MSLLAALLLLAQPLPAAIPNPGFERGLEGWHAWGDRGFRAYAGSNYPAPGGHWLQAGWAARNRTPDDARYSIATRIDARRWRGRRIRISAATRIQGGARGAVILFARAGAAEAGTPLLFSDDWRRQSVVLQVPVRAREIELGFQLERGGAHLDADDVRLEVLR